MSNTQPQTTPPPAATAAPGVDKIAFQFVRDLATSLSDGSVSLPSYPQVAMRLEKMLTADDSNADQLVRVLNAEPVLAARVITMASSAALNPSGRPIADLRTAVVLLGFDALRTTAAAFAMLQVRQASEFKSIEKQIGQLWQESATRSAMCFVVARHTGRFSPDTAMLAGILADIGKLYLLARASKYPQLFTDPPTYNAIVRDWHTSIAQALLESWKTAPEIVAAVVEWTQAVDDQRGSPNLSDVLAAADLLLTHRHEPEIVQGLVEDFRPLQRLGLKAGCASLLADSALELDTLRKALSN
jgi:HD-like signal output (HDOD) protein